MDSELITMGDGLKVSVSQGWGRGNNGSNVFVFSAISLTGGPAGFTGYGTTPSGAIADMYRVMRGDQRVAQ